MDESSVVSDHSRSLAYQNLSDARSKQQITSEQFEIWYFSNILIFLSYHNSPSETLYQSKYTKLFEAVLQIYEKEAKLKTKAENLNRQKDGLQDDIKKNEERKQENEQKIHDLQEDVRRLKLAQDEVDGNNYKLEMDQKALQNDLEAMSKQLENTKKAATDRYLPHITQLAAEIKEQEVSSN